MACHHHDDAGAWVLGALDDHEAGRFHAHLETCPLCREEVARLQPAADTLLLGVVPAGPPPELKDRIMRTVLAEAELLAAAGPEADRPVVAAPRRRRFTLSLRPPLAAALACGLLALGVGAGVLSQQDGADVRTLEAQVTLPQAFGTNAQVRVDEDGDAKLVVSRMPAPPEGRVYQVWVLREGEQDPRPTDALWHPDGTGHATVDVPGGAEGVAAVLVTDEPFGGSRTPTVKPSIVAPLV
jgi:anti-sigma-K factor RskA